MAGKIIVDQIEHSTAGSLDTSYVVNGSAKAWVNFDGTGTPATTYSFGVSSLDDNGTGNYDVNYTTAFSNNRYGAMITVSDKPGSHNDNVGVIVSGSMAAGSLRLYTYRSSTAAQNDLPIITQSSHGDLA
jgi:hypothetical protein